jgi:uncharacterized protein (DUF952 family)
MTPFRADRIYRLCTEEDWASIRQAEILPANDDDRRDGFIHLSPADRVIETARVHYAAHARLVALGMPAAAAGDSLRWEPARDGAKFPHVHGEVRMEWFDHFVRLERDGPDWRAFEGVPQ